MKDVIDLIEAQHLKDSLKSNQARFLDYRKLSEKTPHQGTLAARFLFECSLKLHMKPLTSALAATILHRFYRLVDKNHDYDEFLTAAACLFLAGKAKDDPVKIRDLINVTHCTLNRTLVPLDLSDEYWAKRDALVQAEFFVHRMLKFDLTIVPAHKYLLHYMKSLQNWLGPLWNTAPVAKTSVAFLQDFHISPEILDYQPQHVAICSLSLALQIYGIEVPSNPDSTDLNTNEANWYNVFVEELTREKHWEICQKIINIYNDEETDLETGASNSPA